MIRVQQPVINIMFHVVKLPEVKFIVRFSPVNEMDKRLVAISLMSRYNGWLNYLCKPVLSVCNNALFAFLSPVYERIVTTDKVTRMKVYRFTSAQILKTHRGLAFSVRYFY